MYPSAFPADLVIFQRPVTFIQMFLGVIFQQNTTFSQSLTILQLGFQLRSHFARPRIDSGQGGPVEPRMPYLSVFVLSSRLLLPLYIQYFPFLTFSNVLQYVCRSLRRCFVDALSFTCDMFYLALIENPSHLRCLLFNHFIFVQDSCARAIFFRLSRSLFVRNRGKGFGLSKSIPLLV